MPAAKAHLSLIYLPVSLVWKSHVLAHISFIYAAMIGIICKTYNLSFDNFLKLKIIYVSFICNFIQL